MNYISREELCEYLNPIYDLERLIGRISYRTANPRDLIAFGNSLAMLPYIKQILKEFSGELLKNLEAALDPLADLKELIDKAIVKSRRSRCARAASSRKATMRRQTVCVMQRQKEKTGWHS